MVDISKKGLQTDKDNHQEQTWENPKAPEETHDEREVEQLLRQKKEAERRHENLTKDDNQTKEDI